MIVLNMIIIFCVMIYSLTHKEQIKVEHTETNTYVQYIDRSDKLELPIAGVTEEMYDMLSDQSLLGDTSEDVTVTDSCQEVYQYPKFEYDMSKLTDNDKYLLAKISQCEAGNQNIRTKELVILVVLNRVHSDSFPDTVEEVIKQKDNGVCQFSPLCEGGSWYDTEPSEDAYEAMNNVTTSIYDYSGGALYFESCVDEDNWHSRNLQFLYQSESMRFYK